MGGSERCVSVCGPHGELVKLSTGTLMCTCGYPSADHLGNITPAQAENRGWQRVNTGGYTVYEWPENSQQFYLAKDANDSDVSVACTGPPTNDCTDCCCPRAGTTDNEGICRRLGGATVNTNVPLGFIANKLYYWRDDTPYRSTNWVMYTQPYKAYDPAVGAYEHNITVDSFAHWGGLPSEYKEKCETVQYTDGESQLRTCEWLEQNDNCGIATTKYHGTNTLREDPIESCYSNCVRANECKTANQDCSNSIVRNTPWLGLFDGPCNEAYDRCHRHCYETVSNRHGIYPSECD